jgi:hypothetical protein
MAFLGLQAPGVYWSPFAFGSRVYVYCCSTTYDLSLSFALTLKIHGPRTMIIHNDAVGHLSWADWCWDAGSHWPVHR